MGPRLESRGNRRGTPWARPGGLASMGPRLESRGNVTQAVQQLATLLALQWGRDSRVAEISPESLDELVTSIASMGPRLESRGNGAPAKYPIIKDLPRLCRAGRHATSAASVTATDPFR